MRTRTPGSVVPVTTLLAAATGAALAAACAEPSAAPVTPAPPPAVAAPAPAATAPEGPASPPAPHPAPGPLAPPLLGKLLDVTAAGVTVPVSSSCDVVFVSAAKGSFSVMGRALARGDTAMLAGLSPRSTADLKGAGLAAVVTLPRDCPPGSAPPAAGAAPAIRVVHAGDAKDLAWAGGAMHAHMDFEKELSPDVYVGRLEGTAPVAEHDHASSWELLFAIEGSGTFTLDGAPSHLVAPSVVAVPPGRKHSWQPDAGTKLVAVQAYFPPGPEQRFKALAASSGGPPAPPAAAPAATAGAH